MLRRWFERVTRSVALLLVLALPMQGWAAGVARGCQAHHGGSTSAAPHGVRLPAPGAAGPQAVEPGHADGHPDGHAAAHLAGLHHPGAPGEGIGLEADVAQAASPAPADGHPVTSVKAGSCAACASCAGVAAMPALAFRAQVAPAPSTPVLDRSVPRRARFETDGPERPPRTHLA
jgi:hypothetical protein